MDERGHVVRCHPMKWTVRYENYETARAGHLYCYVHGNGGYKYAGHPDYEPETFNWFIAPDDEDKNYRRALAEGNGATMQEAKDALRTAVRKIADDLVAALEE